MSCPDPSAQRNRFALTATGSVPSYTALPGEYLPPRPTGTRSTYTGPLPSAVIHRLARRVPTTPSTPGHVPCRWSASYQESLSLWLRRNSSEYDTQMTCPTVTPHWRANSHAHRGAQTCTHARANTRTHKTRTRKHASTRAQTHAHARHARTRARAHARPHAHTGGLRAGRAADGTLWTGTCITRQQTTSRMELELPRNHRAPKLFR